MQKNQALIDAIDQVSLDRGAVAFWWLGQISYVVKAAERVLYFDPYLSPSPHRNTPPLLAPEMVTHADFIFGSHDHGDHIDHGSLPQLAEASPQARIVCSMVAAETVMELGIDESRIIALDEGMVFDEDDLRITPIAAAHEFFDRDPRLGFPYLSFVVEVGDLTIYHSGDTCLYDGMLAKLRQWDFDVMFVPINGRDAQRYRNNCIGNMTYQEAVDLLGSLSPRLAVPGHWDMFDGNTADPQLFADYLDVKYPGVPYWIGEHGETVVLPPR